MNNFWSPVSYGYVPVYFLTIAGIPVIWTERTLGKALPIGFASEDPSLVIDDSASVGVEQIDRDRGIAMGLDFGFKLLDTDTVRAWLRKYSRQAMLTADLLGSDTTAHVDDTTGWPSSGTLYCGLERITYTSTTGTSFTGLGRAASGSLASPHKTGTSQQFVTDVPRYFRGREVILWATLMDPTGHVCGSDLISQEARQIWRGRITGSPARQLDGFAFTAQSIDRVLDEKLAGTMSGDVLSAGFTHLVPPAFEFSMLFHGTDLAGTTSIWSGQVNCIPFDGMTNTYMTLAEMRQQVSDAWSAAVTAAGLTVSDHIGELLFAPLGGSPSALLYLKQDAAVEVLDWTIVTDGKVALSTKLVFVGGMASDELKHVDFLAGQHVNFVPSVVNQVLLLRLTSGDPADVPDGAQVRVTSGSLKATFSYQLATVTAAGDVQLSALVPINKQQQAISWENTDGVTAEVLLADSGAWPDLMLRCLESSGTGSMVSFGLRGYYDRLPRGAGYGLPSDAIDYQQILTVLGQDAMATFTGSVTLAGSSFVDVFGGMLALFRKAIVARPNFDYDNAPILLTCVDTAQGSAYTSTITDADLLSHAADPVSSVKRMDSPNVITVTRQPDGSAEDKLIYNDLANVEACGRIEVAYRVDATDRAALTTAALAAATAQFAYDQTLQCLQLAVHPSVTAEVGDLVYVDVTHPGVWQWSANPGRSGYTGPGRVVGRSLNLKSLQVVLTLLVDSGLVSHSLSPSMLVHGFDVAGAATYIDVPAQYAPHVQASLDANAGSIRLYHYQPGQAEGATQYYLISGVDLVAPPAGYCRLAVVSQTGTFSLSTANRSSLTLPPSGSATAYQNLLAHTGDASQWS